MIEEKICISNDEEKILLETIGQKMILISTEDPLNFNENFIWTLYCDFGKIYLKIERKDIVAKMFDIDEDGGNFFISMKLRQGIFRFESGEELITSEKTCKDTKREPSWVFA